MDEETPRKKTWVIPTAALLLIVILSIFALTRKAVTLDPDSPEGVVQTYLQSIAHEDYQAALGVLNAEIRNKCTETDIAGNVYYDSFNAVLGDVTEVGDTVTVEASIQFGSAPLDPGYGGYYEQFRLTREGGRWVIGDDPWPYFTYGCGP